MKRPVTPLDTLNKSDRQKELKYQVGEDKEKLDAMGQESDRKAAKWVKEEDKRLEAIEQKIQDDATEQLHDAKGRVETYKRRLIEEMTREMILYADEVPTGFHWAPRFTDKGLIICFKNPQGEFFARGLTLSMEPKYDLNGVARLIVTALEEMHKQAPKEEEKSPIIIPH